MGKKSTGNPADWSWLEDSYEPRSWNLASNHATVILIAQPESGDWCCPAT